MLIWRRTRAVRINRRQQLPITTVRMNFATDKRSLQKGFIVATRIAAIKRFSRRDYLLVFVFKIGCYCCLWEGSRTAKRIILNASSFISADISAPLPPSLINASSAIAFWRAYLLFIRFLLSLLRRHILEALLLLWKHIELMLKNDDSLYSFYSLPILALRRKKEISMCSLLSTGGIT